MQNEHIEYFKRFSSCYLMWANSNFDRIVSDTVRKHKEILKEEFKCSNPSELEKYSQMLFQANRWYVDKIAAELLVDCEFMGGSTWMTDRDGNVTPLRIKLP